MPRKRMIDPGIWTSEGFAMLTYRQRLLFVGLVTQADDDGRGRAAPLTLKMTIFPGDEELRPQEVGKDLIAIGATDMATLYEAGGRRYYALTGWSRHQRISHPTKSTIPKPPPEIKDLTNNPPESSGALRNPPERSPQVVNQSVSQVVRQVDQITGSPESSKAPISPVASDLVPGDDDALEKPPGGVPVDLDPTPPVDPNGSPEDQIGQVVEFLQEAAGIKATEKDRNQAQRLLSRYTVQQITGGITLGLHRAEKAGTKPGTLAYFERVITEVATQSTDAYQKHLNRTHLRQVAEGMEKP